MEPIQIQENKLFGEWTTANYKNEDPSRFGFDGLHRSGIPTKESGCWLMCDDGRDQDSRWKSKTVRPVILTKEYTNIDGGENIDTRTDSGLSNKYDSYHIFSPFYNLLLPLVYSVVSYDIVNGQCPSFHNFRYDKRGHMNSYWSEQFVRINMKKLSGQSSCSPADLRAAIIRDESFINRQLDIYNGTVFLVCDSSDDSVNPIMQFLHRRYHDLKPWKNNPKSSDNWIYASKEARVVCVHTFHPTRTSYMNMYRGIQELASFFASNPDFYSKQLCI